MKAQFKIGKFITQFDVEIEMREDGTLGPPLRIAYTLDCAASQILELPIFIYDLTFDRYNPKDDVAYYRALQLPRMADRV